MVKGKIIKYIIYGRMSCPYTRKALKETEGKNIFFDINEAKKTKNRNEVVYEDQTHRILLNRSKHHTTIPKIFVLNEDGITYRFLGGSDAL